MLGLYNYIANSKAVQSIVRGGLQLFYKADRTQAPLGEEQVRNNSFDEISGNLVSNPTFELGSELSVNGDFINTLSPNTVEGASGTSNITWDSQAGGSAKLIYNSNDNTSLFLKIPAIIENGKNYYISIDATTITNGSKFKILGNDDQELKINIGNGTTNFSFVAQYSVDNIRIYRQDASQSSQLYINSFTIKELPNWTLINNTTIVDGVANVVAGGDVGSQTGNWSLKSLNNVFQVNKTYRIKFRAKQVSLAGSNAGAFQLGYAYYALFDQVITNEFVDYEFVATTLTSGSILNLTAGGRTAGDVFQIDDISVEQIDPNDRWILEAGWSINNGKVAYNGSATDNVIKQVSVTSGRNYKLEFTIEDYVSGTLDAALSNGSLGSNNIEADGTYSFNITATGTLCAFRSTDSFKGSITNVSVKEITNSIKDHSRNSNDGTLYSGKALDFDGTGDIVELNDANLPGEFAVCTWVKPDTFTHCVVFGDGRDENNVYLNLNWIRLNSPTSITVKINGTSTHYVDLIHGGNIAQDEWSRLIVTRDSNNVVRFGINGVFYSPSNQARAGNFNFNLLGRKQDTEMNGALADVQVYDKAWNDTDVKYDWENPDKDVFDRVDEAQVLGSEEVVDGGFPTGTTAWSISSASNVTFGDGFVNILKEVGAGSTDAYIYQDILQINKTYQVTFSGVVSTGVLFFGTNAVDTNEFVAGTYVNETFNFTTTTTDNFIIRNPRHGTTIDARLTNVSVKEVTTHASHILPTDCKSLLRLNEGAGDRVYDAAPVLGTEEVQNGTFELGSEEVTNGDFSNGTNDWATSNSTIIIEGGALKITSTGGNRPQANQTVNDLVIGRQYKLSAVAKRGTTSNDVEIEISGIASTPTSNRNSTTEYETIFYIFTATATSHTIQAKIDEASEPSGTTAYFDNISVKEVPNWTLGNGWSVANGKARNDGTAGDNNLSQGGLLVVGKSYQITIEVSDFVSGEVEVSAGGTPRGTMTANGKYTFNQVADGTVFYIIAKIFNGSVDNVSVKEIKPAESFAIVGTKAFIHQQPYIPQYAMSSFSKKMFFDGVNDYVTGSFNSNIGPAKDMTFSCWFNYEDVPTSETRESLFALASSAGDTDPFKKFEVDIVEGNKVIVFTGDGSAYSNSTSTINSLTVNKLNHIAVSVNDYDASSGVIKIYINGVLDTTTTRPYYGAPNVGHYRIGTRVSSGSQLYKGIIDEVSLFKSELTQAEVLELYNSGSSFDTTGHSKYNLGEEVSNGTLDLGSEEVVDGDFSSSVNWAESGDQWVINNNTATYTGDNTANELLQEISFIGGRTYQIKIDVASISGTLKVRFNNEEVNKVAFNQTGIQTLYITATGSGNITDDLSISRESGTVSAVLNSVSVKEIPSWSFANGWGVSNNTATYDGTGAQYAKFVQPLAVVAGRTYQVAFTLNDLSGSSVKIGLATSGNTFLTGSAQFTADGTHTIIMTATASDNRIVLQANSATMTFNVSNVSVQEYGLSAYWRNNGADQWDDLSINSNHGTVSGSPTEIFLQEVPFFGKDSLGMFMNKPRLGGLNFNGSGYVEIEDTADLDFPAATGVDNVGEFSVECWVRYKFLSQGSTVNCIYSNGEEVNDVNTFSLITNQDNKIGFYVNGTLCSSASTFSLDEWVHVVGIREHGTNGVKLYINGNTTPEATATNNNTVTNSFNKRIGWDGHANRYLEGVVDDVKLYNRALTPAEIKKNYNATKGKHKN